MSGTLQPGDRVLDLRGVTRSGGMFAGLVAGGVAAWLSNLGLGWSAAGAVVGGVAGAVVASFVGRVVFPAAPGQTVVTRFGPGVVGRALRASLAGGVPITVACAVAALAVGSVTAAGIALVAGAAVSIGLGFLSALA
jgi:hypothetical protein